MVFSIRSRIRILLFTALTMWVAGSLRAQVLPLLNSFEGRTFHGTVNVSWPVLFERCTFVTDSIVLSNSYGAVFRECSIESKTGVLYMTAAGDGLILKDCNVTGCESFGWSLDTTVVLRNYVSNLIVDGMEYEVEDAKETEIDALGLELDNRLKEGNEGPFILSICIDRSHLSESDTASMCIRGLKEGMFVGWCSKNPNVSIEVTEDPFVCKAWLTGPVMGDGVAAISAHTEYGLEEVCLLRYGQMTAYGVGKELERKARKKRLKPKKR